MKNNNLVGKMVFSKFGRDNGEAYIVIDQINSDYLLLANGINKTFQMPKKKNIKHLVITQITDDKLKEEILLKNKNINLRVKRFLKLEGIGKEV